jgi:hypothetical protein
MAALHLRLAIDSTPKRHHFLRHPHAEREGVGVGGHRLRQSLFCQQIMRIDSREYAEEHNLQAS